MMPRCLVEVRFMNLFAVRTANGEWLVIIVFGHRQIPKEIVLIMRIIL